MPFPNKSISVFGINIEYQGRIFYNGGDFIDWDIYRVRINQVGITLFMEFELSKKEKIILFEVITKYMIETKEFYKNKTPLFHPQWDLIPPELQRKISQLNEGLHLGARQLDKIFRKNKKTIRLPNYNLNSVPSDQKQKWNLAFWITSNEDLKQFNKIIEPLNSDIENIVSKSIPIPLPKSFRGRHIILEKEDIIEFQKNALDIKSIEELPFMSLYAFAIQNYENKSFSAFIVTLAASIETGLKWYLGKNGDDIAGYLLDEPSSPSPAKLLSIAMKSCNLEVPDIYKKWIGRLVEIRNKIVHKPKEIDFKPLEVVRFLAIGEAILFAIQGEKPFKYAGFLMKFKKAYDTLPKNSIAIIIREEKKL